MKSETHHYLVTVYYDATDLNGHANYASLMNYFSRAREEVVGMDNFIKMVHEDRIGMAVYNANMQFRSAARFGDTVDIRTNYQFDGEYKILVHQEAWVEGQPKPAVTADFEVICVDVDKGTLVKIPPIHGFNPIVL